MEYPVVKIVFDYKHRASATVKGAVSVEVYFNRQRKRYSTGVSVYAPEWSPRQGVTGRFDAEVLNESVRRCLRHALTLVDNMREQGRAFSWAEMDRWMAMPDDGGSLVAFVERRAQERTDISEGTRKNHRKLVRSLREFGRMSAFSDVSAERVREYDDFLHRRGYKQTTVASYHKFLKVYLNDAARRGLPVVSPYGAVKVDRGRSEARRYLTEAELEAVKGAVLTGVAAKARDLFVFQCYTGLAFSDMAKFDFERAERRGDKWVVLDVRRKTGTDFYLVLLSPAVEVLERYAFRLPSMTNQKYNLFLKVVGEAAGLRLPLTSHMGRHTFAVYCLNHGVQIETLARMMGHTDIKTTQIYARIVNPTVEAAFDALERGLKS